MMYTKQDCGLTELGPESEQFTMVHVHTEHTGPADRLPCGRSLVDSIGSDVGPRCPVQDSARGG